MGDRNTKFFHDTLKRNATRNSILTITKGDGSVITSVEDITQEFVAFYTSLLGTEVQTLPVDDDMFEWGPKLSFEHALELSKRLLVTDFSPPVYRIGTTLANGQLSPFFLRRRSLRKFINFAGFSFETLREHQLPGRKFAILRKMVVLQLKKGDSLFLQRLADIRNRVVTTFGSSEATIQRMAEWSNIKGLETSKAYDYFRSKLKRQPWKAVIWKAFITPKYLFILWLRLRGRLATRDRLAFLQDEASCSLCINTHESAKHLFFE
ncbi:hypothetical protein Salat_2928200 [Sesamum alatum]|uniref:Reverse transcriptase zinc-binding domain-containing protein n=1 Tax=Sesamum alatum TaxID=300844 RepID=A0AAE1XIZ4_9LAMI|nr:hypothetical protein Salat_2928200 [Sesamum alatum]